MINALESTVVVLLNSLSLSQRCETLFLFLCSGSLNTVKWTKENEEKKRDQ